MNDFNNVNVDVLSNFLFRHSADYITDVITVPRNDDRTIHAAFFCGNDQLLHEIGVSIDDCVIEMRTRAPDGQLLTAAERIDGERLTDNQIERVLGKLREKRKEYYDLYSI